MSAPQHAPAEGPQRLDVAATLRSRAPGVARWIPRFVTSGLERLICQKQLNRLLEDAWPARGVEFCKRITRLLRVDYEVVNADRLPAADDRRVVYVSNHPLGALDGICLLEMVGERHGPRVHFVVNDLLNAVDPLTDVWLPINKHGRQSRQSSQRLEDVFAGPDPIIIFPAGLVSRKQRGGEVCDLKWRKMFVQKALEYGRDIVPLHFDASNSQFFYNFARLRRLSGLRFNFEMILLPREIFACKGKKFRVTVGRRIPAETLNELAPAKMAAVIKKIVYSLAPAAKQN